MSGRAGGAPPVLECVVNVSEGRDEAVLSRLAAACGGTLLDLHRDPWHHRAVLTLGGDGPDVEAAARRLGAAAVEMLDVRSHRGVHPRIGVLDVVPFVPLPYTTSGPLTTSALVTTSGKIGTDLAPAVGARDRFATWAGTELALPCFLYGPLPAGGDRTLPEVRKGAFTSLAPDTGPPRPHPSAGAAAVGARLPMVAYNLWLSGGGIRLAKAVAASLRGPRVRALGLELDGAPQVSCNLLEPGTDGPAEVFDQVAAQVALAGAWIERAELVGLVPRDVVAAIPRHRWPELDLGPDVTVEARLEERGVRTR